MTSAGAISSAVRSARVAARRRRSRRAAITLSSPQFAVMTRSKSRSRVLLRLEAGEHAGRLPEVCPSAGRRATGSGTSPRRELRDQLAHALGRHVVVVGEVDRTTGACSHAPRHSSSCRVMSPSCESSPPCGTPAASCAASQTSFAPRSAHDRFVHTRHDVLAGGTQPQHRVEAGDGLDLGGGQAEQGRDLAQRLARDAAPPPTAPGTAAASRPSARGRRDTAP